MELIKIAAVLCCTVAVIGDYKFERQTVYGLTELVPEVQVIIISF